MNDCIKQLEVLCWWLYRLLKCSSAKRIHKVIRRRLKKNCHGYFDELYADRHYVKNSFEKKVLE